MKVTKINGGYKEVIKSQMPDSDKQILRTIMMAELDAQNMYEQLKDCTDNKDIHILLDSIMKEKYEHFEMAEELLEELCKDED